MRNLYCNDRVSKMFKCFTRAEDFSPLVSYAINQDAGFEADKGLIISVTKRIKNAMFDPELFSEYRRNISINSAKEFARELYMSCALDDMFKREDEGYSPLPELEAFENNALRMVLQFFGGRELDGAGFVKELDEDVIYDYKSRKDAVCNQSIYTISDAENKTKVITPKLVLLTILRMLKDGNAMFELFGEDYHRFINCISNNMRNEKISTLIESHRNQYQMSE